MNELNVYERDILAQPEDMKNAFGFYKEQGYYDRMAKIDLSRYSKIVFTGIGSSYSSCINISRAMENAGYDVVLAVTSDLVYYQMDLIDRDSLIVCVSQSGESGEVVSLIEKLDPDVNMISITNDPDSTLARRGTETFLLHVDGELAVSTRTYLSSLIMQYLLVNAFLGKDRDEVYADVDRAIGYLEDTVAGFFEMQEKMASVIGYPDHLQIIARGWSYQTVDAGSLFTKEVAKYPSIGFEGAQFRHGPFEMSVFDFAGIIFAPKGAGSDMQVNLARDLVDKGSRIALVTDRDDIESTDRMLVIRQEYANEFFAPLSQIVPVQCFGDYMAKSRGIRVGEFVYGTKVTVIQ